MSPKDRLIRFIYRTATGSKKVLLAFFIFTPLFILINVMELKMIEEPELAMRLGKPYLEYRAKTPMFFPWRKPE